MKLEIDGEPFYIANPRISAELRNKILLSRPLTESDREEVLFALSSYSGLVGYSNTQRNKVVSAIKKELRAETKRFQSIRKDSAHD